MLSYFQNIIMRKEGPQIICFFQVYLAYFSITVVICSCCFYAFGLGAPAPSHFCYTGSTMALSKSEKQAESQRLCLFLKQHLLLEELVNYLRTPDISREREISDCLPWRDNTGYLVDCVISTSLKASPHRRQQHRKREQSQSRLKNGGECTYRRCLGTLTRERKCKC